MRTRTPNGRPTRPGFMGTETPLSSPPKPRKTTPPVARRPPKKKAASSSRRGSGRVRLLVRALGARPCTPPCQDGAGTVGPIAALRPRTHREVARALGACARSSLPCRGASIRPRDDDVAPRTTAFCSVVGDQTKSVPARHRAHYLCPHSTRQRTGTSPRRSQRARRIALQVTRTASCKEASALFGCVIDCESNLEGQQRPRATPSYDATGRPPPQPPAPHT